MPCQSDNGVVIFDPAKWLLAYPEFTCISADQANAYFDRATLILNNTACSPVCDLNQRSALLNLLTAHIAKLNFGSNGQPASGVVGRISQASEGSVSMSADMGPVTTNSAWYLQTAYGAEYWQATAGYRTAVYLPGRSVNPTNQTYGVNGAWGNGPGFGGFGWPW
jgi:hypothetical protein